MRAFEYLRPETVDEAVAFLAANADDALMLGGGTAAVVLLNMGVLRPRYVVDLGGIAALKERTVNGGLHLGALTSIRTLERDPEIRRAYGLLAEAAGQVANVRVRNVATIGGAVAYAEPQTDTPVALTAMGATLTVAGPSGSRQVPIDGFYVGPYETVLAPGELVTALDVPAVIPGSGSCHLKFTVGSPENKPVANVSAIVTIDASSGRCADARIVMGAVGSMPVTAAAAGSLRGDTLTDERIAAVAAAAAEETDPVEDLRGPVWYKRRITRVLVERALKCALLKVNELPA